MLEICPHLIPDYFSKVKDIIIVYRSQILEQIDYDSIGDDMVFRGAYSQEQHVKLKDSTTINQERMAKVLEMIQQRLWGFENLVMSLMNQNLNPWLAEELFQAYARYLVEHIKKEKSLKKCDCPEREVKFQGFLNDRLIQLWNTVDSWIGKLGTSLGYFNRNVLPSNSNVSSFVDEKCPSNFANTVNVGEDSNIKPVLSSRKDEILQPEATNDSDYLNWTRDDIEDEIADLEISRISCMSLDLDWDMDDEPLEYNEESENVKGSDEISSDLKVVTISTQTESPSANARQKIAEKRLTAPVASLKSPAIPKSGKSHGPTVPKAGIFVSRNKPNSVITGVKKKTYDKNENISKNLKVNVEERRIHHKETAPKMDPIGISTSRLRPKKTPSTLGNSIPNSKNE